MDDLALVPVCDEPTRHVAAWIAEDMREQPGPFVNVLFLFDHEFQAYVDQVVVDLGNVKRAVGLQGYIHRTQWSVPPYDIVVVFGHPFTSAAAQLRAALKAGALRPGGLIFAVYCVSHDNEAVACHRPDTLEADECWLDPVPYAPEFESQNDPETYARHRWYDTELTRWHMARYRFDPTCAEHV